LRGDIELAIELYHQSLSLKPDDTFTSEMLTEALKDALELAPSLASLFPDGPSSSSLLLPSVWDPPGITASSTPSSGTPPYGIFSPLPPVGRGEGAAAQRRGLSSMDLSPG